MRARLILAALSIPMALLTHGCQSTPTSSLAPAEDPLAKAPPVSSGLDGESLATLLTAEFAGQRGDYRQASHGYLQVADRYDSLALVERATLAARFANDPELLERSAKRWQTLAPDAEAPTRLLSSLALQRGDWVTSLEQRLALSERGIHGELANFSEQAIEQDVELAPLLERLRDYLARHPGSDQPHHYDAILATALLEAASGELGRAESRLETLARSHPELPALWLARTRIAMQQQDLIGAREAARRGIEIAPDDGRFLLLAAQVELQLSNVEAAESQLNALLKRHEDNQELRLALAQLYLEEGYPGPAKRLLLPMVEGGKPAPQVFMLLGNIAAEAGEVDNALLYYRQVPPGDGFLQSRLLAAQMLVEADRLGDARDFLQIERLRHEDYASGLTTLEVELLDQQDRKADADALLRRELSQNPEAHELRYMRAMRAFEQGDLAAMEADLRHIIERQPDHAMALNALGYTLADMTDRLDEAQRLVERAYRLSPDNAAILDSLGWVYHKQGDDARALPYLERAYATMPDQEVAAHLAEVLWALDEKHRARALIEESLDRFTRHPAIDSLLERIPELRP